MNRKNIKILLALASMVCLIAVSYSNTTHSPFAFDDYLNIIDNPHIKIANLSADQLVSAAASGPAKYRWLPNLSLALQYYYFGFDTFPFHLFNLAVHILCAIALYFLLLTTLDHAGGAPEKTRAHEIVLAAVLLWALHPVQTNAVTYIVQRMTSLSALFYLLSLLFYARGRLPNLTPVRQTLLFAASLLSFLLAVTSKENGATLPLMVICYEIFFVSPDLILKRRRRVLLVVAAAGLVLLFLGWLWIGGNVIDRILQGYQGRYFSLPERLMTETRILLFYLSLILLPLPSRQNINHDILISTSPISPPATLLAILGIILLCYGTVHTFNKNRILSFAILWFLATLAIESSIIPLELVFEHRLYLPSTFLVFAVVLLLYRSCCRPISILRAGLVLVVICLTGLTWNRNLIWQSRVGLWTDSISKSPEYIRSYVNLARALRMEKKLPQAEASMLKALEIEAGRQVDRNNPAWKQEMSQVHSTLATIYRDQDNLAKARYHAEEAVRLHPEAYDSLLTMAITMVQTGDYQAADSIFRRLAAGGVKTVDLYNNWGISAFNLGETDRAILFFQQALRLDPNHGETHYNLGIAYGKKGMREEARREMARSVGL